MIARAFEVNRSWKLNDIGLLIFRVTLSASLFIHHGWEKLANFHQMAQHFPDPLHIGVVPSLIYAALADAICAVLVAVGLVTRIASFLVLVNLAVVYFIVENALNVGGKAPLGPPPGMPGPPPGAHMELVFVYLVGYLLLTLVGPGAYSLDRRIGRFPL